MRSIAAVPFLAILVAGCLLSPAPACSDEMVTLFFQPGGGLAPALPAGGSEPGNGFAQAFLTDDLNEWLSGPVPDGQRITGDVVLEYWVRNTGAVAPLAVGPDPTEGYHFFNQFGSDRALQPNYALQFADILAPPGRVDHYVHTITMPEGGFFLEPEDRLRVLLTGLQLESVVPAHEILLGGDTPSQVRYTAACWTPPTYVEGEPDVVDVVLPGNRGLLFGAVPQEEGVNLWRHPITIQPDTHRLTITLEQTGGRDAIKDDMDLQLRTLDGKLAWEAGSPYADETLVMWRDNLLAAAPHGQYVVEVHSYSGTFYEGRLTVQQDRAG